MSAPTSATAAAIEAVALIASTNAWLAAVTSRAAASPLNPEATSCAAETLSPAAAAALDGSASTLPSIPEA
jgi:hypothetical protein